MALGGVDREPTPAGADFDHVVVRSEAQLDGDPLEFGHLGLLQRGGAVCEVPARVGHGGVQHRARRGRSIGRSGRRCCAGRHSCSAAGATASPPAGCRSASPRRRGSPAVVSCVEMRYGAVRSGRRCPTTRRGSSRRAHASLGPARPARPAGRARRRLPPARPTLSRSAAPGHPGTLEAEDARSVAPGTPGQIDHQPCPHVSHG